MGKKQINFTRMPHYYKDKKPILPLHGVTFRVLEVLERKTLGFNKTQDQISLTQFQRLTGLPRSSVCRALIQLQEFKIIKIKKGRPEGRIKTLYELEIDPSKWNQSLIKSSPMYRTSPMHRTSPTDETTSSPTDGTKVVLQVGPVTPGPKEILTKENILKKEIPLPQNLTELKNLQIRTQRQLDEKQADTKDPKFKAPKVQDRLKEDIKGLKKDLARIRKEIKALEDGKKARKKLGFKPHERINKLKEFSVN